MNAKDLRNLLSKVDDKFNFFTNRENLAKLAINIFQLITIINEFLTDEEKGNLFKYEHFKKLESHAKSEIIKSISDDKIKFGILTDFSIVEDIQDYYFKNLIKSLGDEYKIQLLRNDEFIAKYDLKNHHIEEIIKTLNDDNKRTLMLDEDFVRKNLKLENYHITKIIMSFSDDNIKLKFINRYKFSKYYAIDIDKTFNDENKTKIILNNPQELNRSDLENLISTLSDDKLVDFINDNKTFIELNKIKIFNITWHLSEEKQLNFISRIDDLDIDINEKRKILAILDLKTKSKIDTTNFPSEYISAINMQVSEYLGNINSYRKIIVDFNQDLEIYKGLDELIYLNPMQLQDIDRSKIQELCDICPQVQIKDNLGLYHSTVEEYKNGEAWIESVLQGINPEWSDIQKIAFIDNAIGKKISYSPDCDTEVFDDNEARTLWKIIDSGYGICNGIAQVEEYMLSRIGIQVESISSGSHSFLKLKNIEVPSNNGESIRGDTILDPTWNLTAHRYGAFPDNFCKSYEEIRKHDIRASDGKDLECHKNDGELENATLDLEEQVLREVFTSIGLADRDGNFPIKTLIDESKAIDDLNLPVEQSIEKQLLLLSKYYPEFDTCQNSTMDILTSILLNQENLNFDKCVVNRVYSRDDENKRPVLYVYIDSQECGQKFYIPDKETNKFVEMSSEEFVSRFECYEMDLERDGGYRTWETAEMTEVLEDLTRSSGSVVASEGEGR